MKSIIISLFLMFLISCSTCKRVGVYSGTFNPPHIGHYKVVEFVKQKLGLDRVYVIPNVTSGHKKNITPYKYRKEMTQISYKDLDGVIVAKPELEVAFKKGDIPAVLKSIRKMHSKQTIYQMMGDDSFLRYKRAVRGKISKDKNITVVVLEREGLKSRPKRVQGLPIVYLSPQLKKRSSTKIRNELKNGQVPVDLDIDVYKYIVKNKLLKVKSN